MALSHNFKTIPILWALYNLKFSFKSFCDKTGSVIKPTNVGHVELFFFMNKVTRSIKCCGLRRCTCTISIIYLFGISISEFINFDHPVGSEVSVSLKVANYTKRKFPKS